MCVCYHNLIIFHVISSRHILSTSYLSESYNLQLPLNLHPLLSRLSHLQWPHPLYQSVQTAFNIKFIYLIHSVFIIINNFFQEFYLIHSVFILTIFFKTNLSLEVNVCGLLFPILPPPH